MLNETIKDPLYESQHLSLAGSTLQYLCHKASHAAGWWSNLETGERLPLTRELISEKLILIISEVTEGFEAHRKNKMDDHLPHRKGLETELADCIIRVFDLGGALDLDLGGAIAEKMEYNRTRKDHSIEHRKSAEGKKC